MNNIFVIYTMWKYSKPLQSNNKLVFDKKPPQKTGPQCEILVIKKLYCEEFQTE